MTADAVEAAINALLSPHGGGPGHVADRARAASILLEHAEEGHAAVTRALAAAPPWANVVALIMLLPRFERLEDVALLAEILRTGTDPRRIVAAQALAAHPHRQALAALLDALAGRAEVARFAAQALGLRGDRAAIGPLIELAESENADESVREAAAESLAQLKARSS
jgi:HEAT repeat protein